MCCTSTSSCYHAFLTRTAKSNKKCPFATFARPPRSRPHLCFFSWLHRQRLTQQFFLAFYWMLCLSAPSARSCQVREGILQLLTTLLGVLRKSILLAFQRTSTAALLLLFHLNTQSSDHFLIHSSSSPPVHHHNNSYLLAALHHTKVMGITTGNVDSLLDTTLHHTKVPGVSTDNPTMEPQTWVDLYQINFWYGKHYNPNYERFHPAMDMAYATNYSSITLAFFLSSVLLFHVQMKVMP